MKDPQSGTRIAAYRSQRHSASEALFPVRFAAVCFVVAAAMLASCNVDKLISSTGLNGGSEPQEPPGGNGGPTATRLAVLVQPGGAFIGSEILPAFQVTATDQSGNPVTTFTGAVFVDLVASPAGGVLTGPLSRPASGGVVTFSGLSIDKAGTGYRLRATSAGLVSVTSAAFNISMQPEPPPPPATRIAGVSGNAQSDTISATLAAPYVVRVTDADGDPVAGVAVSWSITAGGGSISPTTAQTNSEGRATALHTLGTAVGANSATASVSGLQGSPVTFTSTATHGTPASLVFVQQPTSTENDETIRPPVVVAVRDRVGNLATGASTNVMLTLVPLTGNPLARLSGKTTQKPSQGLATFGDLRINLVGVGYRLRAASGALTADSDPFNITPDNE